MKTKRRDYLAKTEPTQLLLMITICPGESYRFCLTQNVVEIELLNIVWP